MVEWFMLDNNEKIYMISIAILCIIVVFGIVNHFNKPDYTIQDVHNWCCRNIHDISELNSTYTPTGESCEWVIMDIYNGDCMGIK